MRPVVALIENVAVWLLVLGCTARLIRLFAVDELPWVKRPRDKIIERYGVESTVAYFVTCVWCLGFWVSLVAALTVCAAQGYPWWAWIGTPFALNMFASALVIKTD